MNYNKITRNVLAQEIIQHHYKYHDGQLLLVERYGNARVPPVGAPIGATRKDGYVIARYAGKIYRLHNLIWIYHYGDIPEHLIVDHIIPVSQGGTNHIENLQLLTPAQNKQKSMKQKTNTSGYIGVSGKDEYYQSYYQDNGKRAYNGIFKNPAVAALLRDCAVYAQSQMYTLNFCAEAVALYQLAPESTKKAVMAQHEMNTADLSKWKDRAFDMNDI